MKSDGDSMDDTSEGLVRRRIKFDANLRFSYFLCLLRFLRDSLVRSSWGHFMLHVLIDLLNL